jgi:hypothetical protein
MRIIAGIITGMIRKLVRLCALLTLSMKTDNEIAKASPEMRVIKMFIPSSNIPMG